MRRLCNLHCTISSPRYRNGVMNDESIFIIGVAEISDLPSGDPDDPKDWAADIESSASDAVALGIAAGPQRAWRLVAYRCLATSHDLYYWLSPDRRKAIVSDSFRDVIAQLQEKDRRPSPEGLIDHFLFRTTPVRQTLVEGVRRLGRGELLTMTSDPDGRVTADLYRVARLPHDGGRHLVDLHDVLEGIDTELKRSLALWGVDGSCHNLYSGGVDSTLLQVLAPCSVPFNVRPDTPEFARELQYADHTARLLGIRPVAHAYVEDRYLGSLRQTISVSGLPPHHLQTILLDEAFSSDRVSRCLTGEAADSLFGSRPARFASAIERMGMLLCLLRSVRSVPLGPLRKRLDTLFTFERRLRYSLSDREGLAANFVRYGELRFLSAMFDPEKVRARIENRVRYALACVDVAAEPDTVWAQVELSQWMGFLCEDTASIWRQLANARRVELITPFVAKGLVELVCRISPRERYAKGGCVKGLLKRLLARYVPSYPVARQKGSTGLPLERFFRSGPLAGAIGAYRRPDFVTQPLLFDIASSGGQVAWNLLTYQVWHEQVLMNRQLSPIGTRV